jgi:signal transduction histidine kinase/FixJ family two-component response regulator
LQIKAKKEAKVESQLDAVKILIIDDEKDIRDGSERILSRMGCQVLKASRGEEGLETLANNSVAIVLLDMKMPGMDGMEVLSRIRKMDEQILVIVITGYATVETAIAAMKGGAYDFVPKPFEPDQLRIVVNRALEKLRLTREARNLEEERKRNLADLGTEKSRVRTIIESLPNGVVVTNTQGQVALMNPAFLRHLNLDPGLNSGDLIENYVSDEGFCKLVMDISSGKHVDYDDIPTYELSVSEGKYLLARGRPVIGEKNECLGAVVNIMDITAMKALDQLKSEFVAKVSHELRSPLSTIHEQLALVLSDIVGEASEADQHLLSRAKEKTKGLISTIGDLLDLSRIEVGAASMDSKPVPINALLENIVDFLGTKAKAKGQSLVFEALEDSSLTVTADPVALESVFGNLITNAINYTQENGEIKVRADLAGINIRVEVTDNGYGMKAKYLENIFEKFYRIKDEKTRYITGSGLGLPIVKGIVDSLGGFVNVDSEFDKGTVFTVLLPVTKATEV